MSGLELFRKSQIKSLRKQTEIKIKIQSDSSPQVSLFDDSFLAEFSFNSNFDDVKKEVESHILSILGNQNHPIKYRNLLNEILQKFIIDRTSINKICADLRKVGKIQCSNWIPGSRVPKDEYLLTTTIT